MKVAVVGSRSFNDYNHLSWVLNQFKISEIISGGAIGADTLAQRYADEHLIKTVIHKPQWHIFGKSAGYKRNVLIIEKADMVVAFWDGKSKGTKHSISIAQKMNKELVIEYV